MLDSMRKQPLIDDFKIKRQSQLVLDIFSSHLLLAFECNYIFLYFQIFSLLNLLDMLDGKQVVVQISLFILRYAILFFDNFALFTHQLCKY